MLDKVVFNLLSNAFKFTNDNGFIHVYVSKEGDEATVSEIAYKVGFSSPAYFFTVFKSKFGVAPKAFKEK